MSSSKTSPNWHQGEASVFARVVGVKPVKTISSDDPIHSERLYRYDRNILYYQKAQYHEGNKKHVESRNFLEMRINYSGICRRSVNTKANWLFGEPLSVNAIPLDDNGVPVDETLIKPPADANPGNEPTGDGIPEPTTVKRVKDKINQAREHNESDYWDWVMAVMGIVCGDYFVQVSAEADDLVPSIQVHDPSYCFPDYPDAPDKPMRAFQLQYKVERRFKENGKPQTEEVQIVEDWRLEVQTDDTSDELELLDVIPDDQLGALQQAAIKEEAPPERLICVYRKFEDGKLVPKSKRSIGIPAIPFVHGINTPLWNNRYGSDEISDLIPMLEKYNETFHHAERIARTNAHAKLALSGVNSSDRGAIAGDVDDVIYLGEKGTANVISLPSDTTVMKFITDTLKAEMHADASMPNIVDGDPSGFGSAPSGLSLRIQYGPLRDITSFHRLFYGRSLAAVYTLVLMFDEMVIDGKQYSSKWDYKSWKFKFGWHDAMPVSQSEAISDMRQATDPTIPLLSHRTAREQLPGVDPDQEEKRLQEQNVQKSQQSLEGPPAEETEFEPGISSLAPGSYEDLFTGQDFEDTGTTEV